MGRRSVLTKYISHRLTLDIWENPNYSCEQIRLLRTEYAEFQTKALENRFHYLKRKDKEQPKDPTKKNTFLEKEKE